MQYSTQVAKAARTLGIKVRSATQEEDKYICLFAKNITKHLQFLLDIRIYVSGYDHCNGTNEIYLSPLSCERLIQLANKKEENKNSLFLI